MKAVPAEKDIEVIEFISTRAHSAFEMLIRVRMRAPGWGTFHELVRVDDGFIASSGMHSYEIAEVVARKARKALRNDLEAVALGA